MLICISIRNAVQRLISICPLKVQTTTIKEELKIQHSKDENKSSKLITVFYDGKCGLCNKEIDHYRKISPVGIFHWQDITKSNNADLTKAGIRYG